MSPKVSVIIPNYNHSKYLIKRIQSVLNQTYQDFEVILLDDDSTDGSIDILMDYKNHPKVSHLVLNKTNSGSPFKQWEKGIALAQGEYIWIAESDDYASEIFLETLVSKLGNGVGLAYCRSAAVKSDGEINEGYFWPDGLDFFRWKKDFFNSGMDELKTFFVYRNAIPNASSCVFKKSLVSDFECVKQMKYAGDWLFWTLVLKESNLYYCAESLNFFRFHENSTRQIKDRKKEVLRLKEYLKIIAHVKMMCLETGNLKIHYSKYAWIFQELSQKKDVIGIFRYLFPPLPFRMLLEYYRYQLKIGGYKR